MVEIPATPNNTLLKHLSVLSLLKKEHIEVGPNKLVLGVGDAMEGSLTVDLDQNNRRDSLLRCLLS